jgi:hypothetical protein
MRKFVITLAAIAGLGLWTTGGAIAAPANGAVIDTAATATESVLDVHGYRRHHHRGGWHCPPRRCWKWVCHRVWRYR